MSEAETHEAQARQGERAAAADFEQARNALRTHVVEWISPKGVASIAERVVKSEPDLSRELGASGVATMIQSMDAYLAESRLSFQQHFNAISWPQPLESVRESVDRRNEVADTYSKLVGDALKVTVIRQLDEVMRGAGYLSMGPIVPSLGSFTRDFLQDQGQVAALVEAAVKLSECQDAVERARKQDRAEALDNLWGEALGLARRVR